MMPMTDHPTTIGGIPLPSDAPLFLALIGVHIIFGLTCVLAGLAAMLSAKRPGRHPWLGTTYVWSLLGVFLTMAALSALRWAENYPLFLLGAGSFLSALLGRAARRYEWRRWAPIHIVGMSVSYLLLLTAFYVDNGKTLPLWNQLPQAAFWSLPSLIGVPIIIWQLLFHPLARPRQEGG